jgi:hypothetical protein
VIRTTVTPVVPSTMSLGENSPMLMIGQVTVPTAAGIGQLTVPTTAGAAAPLAPGLATANANAEVARTTVAPSPTVPAPRFFPQVP